MLTATGGSRRWLPGFSGIILLLLATVATTGRCLADDSATLNQWRSGFHSLWQADSCVQARQSWTDYWSWVGVFYFGKDGRPGWFADNTNILSRITDAGMKATVRAQLTSLGRRIAGEWSKDNACRKIRSESTGLQSLTEPGKPAIEDWGNQLKAAVSADSGNGQSIESTLNAIASEVNALGIKDPVQ